MIFYHSWDTEINNRLKNDLDFSADYKLGKRSITGRCKPCNVIKHKKLKTVLCAIATLFFMTPLYADWTILDSGTTVWLSAVDFPVDANTGYVVGYKGTILKTTNAGESWKKQRSRTRSVLRDVDFVDNLTGYVAGFDGKILKTTNGGSSWTELDSGTTRHLYTINFPVDANVGYAGGYSRTLLKTTDGGQTWQPLSGISGSIKEIVFPENNQTGYVSSYYGSLGYIYKTTDGGQNWTRVLWLEDAELTSMSFPVDDMVGYVVNSSYDYGTLKTTDGGATWNYVTAGVTAKPRAVDFPVDTQTGVAVGKYGDIITTSDGGTSWTEGKIVNDTWLDDVDFIDNTVGYAVGGSGLIAKSSDGGAPAIESIYLHPTGSGSVNTFTDMTGCSIDWDCVNDQSGNLGTGTPETLNRFDYVGDSSGNRVMFALDDAVLDANDTITEICVSVAASQYNGTKLNISYQRVGIDSSPIDFTTSWGVSYTYDGMSTHCWGDLNWSGSDLDALEIGAKSVSPLWLQVGQIYVKVFYTSP